MAGKEEERQSVLRPRLGWSALLILLLVALAPRVLGILWGSTHADENFGTPARMLGGQIVPDYHYYPPFYYYLNAMSYGAMFVLGRLLGVWQDTEAFRANYFTHAEPFWVAARLVSAVLGALASPIAARLAWQAGAGRLGAWVVGLGVALVPMNVLYSHLSKGDTGMATAMLLLMLLHCCFLDRPGSRWLVIGLGAAAALAVSFKQSAVFFAIPLVALEAVHIVMLQKKPVMDVVKFTGLYGLAGTIVWIPLNIGIVLDLGNFLESQEALRLMVARDTTFFENVIRSVRTLSGTLTGAGIPAFMLWLLVPVLRRNFKEVSLWVATALGILWVIVIAGGYAKPSTYMPYACLMTLSAGLCAVHCWESRQLLQKCFGAIAMGGIVLFGALGTGAVTRQALATPMSDRLTEVITSIATPGETRILGGLKHLDVSIDPLAAEDEYARHMRLAEKYNVELPERAADRAEANAAAPPPYYYVRPLPAAIGGFERYEDEEIMVVKAFSWPLQQEEYDLAYWLKLGFSIFVVSGEERSVNSGIPAYDRFYSEIRDRCKLVSEIGTTRPLFWEEDLKVYEYVPEAV